MESIIKRNLQDISSVVDQCLLADRDRNIKCFSNCVCICTRIMHQRFERAV